MVHSEELFFPARSAAAVKAQNVPVTSSASTYIAAPEKAQSPIAAQAPRAGKTIAVGSVSSQSPAEIPAPAELSKSVVSMPPLDSAGELDTARRPHISEWPEDGFSYPIAPRRTLTGTVLLKAVIGINGRVIRVDILSGNRLLAGAAAEAVWHWRYPPQKVNGIPSEAETNVVINFRGDDAVSISFPAM